MKNGVYLPREIGVLRVATNGRAIYSVDYTTEQNPIPVFRSFDIEGRLRWQREFPDLRAYSFTDLVVLADRVLTVGSPHDFEAAGSQAIVLSLDSFGEIKQRTEIKLDQTRRKSFYGIEAHIATWNNRIVLAINNGSELSRKPKLVFRNARSLSFRSIDIPLLT